jgi:hypothetical protein
MNQRIIYKNNDGTVALVIPAPDCGLTIEQIALKDVPAGKPFKIINAADMLEDMMGLVVNDADLTDGIGENYGAAI